MTTNHQPEKSDTPEHLRTLDKLLIAFFAGIAPIATKYLARDQGTPLSELTDVYIATGACLVFLAAGMCYLSKETNRMKLFMLAVSAPALISNMSAETNVGGQKLAPTNKASIFNPIVTSAEAAGHEGSNLELVRVGFANNIKRYFGTDPGASTEDGKFWVIVLSTRDEQYAQQIAAKINGIKPELMAFVGNRRPNNPFFPVIIGARNDREVANQLMQEGIMLSEQMPELSGRPYLDSYVNRR
ncbi:MAG: SPOR domain-containing protein [Hyphomicrobiales bacterium]|nr:SPOR domain-containing protein [Hyphomicrobiales bacterium]